MHTIENASRRQFLGTAGGLTVGLALWGSGAPMQAAQAAAATSAVNTWLTVGSDESVVLTVAASDMGQGSVSGLAQILAEDLFVDWTRVQVAQGAPTLASPAPIGAAINTVGSSVTRSNYWRLRDAAAVAREMLVLAAMTQLGDSSRSNYTVDNGVIRHSSGATRTYGQVASIASQMPVPASAPLVPDSQLRVIGRPLPRKDIPLKVDGSAVYGLDARIPGMLFAVIRHCPSVGGVLAAIPSAPGGSVAVVPVAVPLGNGRGANTAGNVNAVAVVAATTWDAMRAARSLQLQWKLPAAASSWSTDTFFADAAQLLASAPAYVPGGANPPGTSYIVENSGDAAGAIEKLATQKLDATYQLPYLSHACMEVLSCTVDYVPGVRCTVHAPTQSARGALALVASMTGLAASQIEFRTTFLGGGLGRKAEQDFIGQAVQVAMALKRPVQLMWPREEDFTHDQYRPMALVRVRAGLDPSGQVAGWHYRNVSPSILGQRGATLGPAGDSQGYEGSAGLPYLFAARRVEWVSHTAPVPVGFWRSVGASINAFAVECAIDELAALANQDAYQFRRARMTDSRWAAVLDAAAALGGWATPLPSGVARGIAICSAFNSVVATVVELGRSGTAGFIVRKVSVALDPLIVVNPQNVEAQVVGGVVHGLNAALYGEQVFLGGAAVKRNFNTNRMLRLQEMPQVAVTLISRGGAADRSLAIGGVGELGVPSLAPALANAVSRLNGTRVRKLPLIPNATMGGL